MAIAASIRTAGGYTALRGYAAQVAERSAGFAASLMRRIGICEERGSGWDKVVFQTELYQLPAPLPEATDDHTK